MISKFEDTDVNSQDNFLFYIPEKSAILKMQNMHGLKDIAGSFFLFKNKS